MRPLDFMKPSVILLFFSLLFVHISLLASQKDSSAIRYHQLYLKNLADEAIHNGDVNRAISLLSYALPYSIANPDMPLNKEVLDMLYHIHYNEDIISGNYPQDSLLVKDLQGIHYVHPDKDGSFKLVSKGNRTKTSYQFSIPKDITTVKFSQDEIYMLCQSWKGLWLWDIATGKKMGGKIDDAAWGFFSPDGDNLLVISPNYHIRIINLKDRSRIKSPEFPRSKTAAYSNCGNYVALVPIADDKVVEIWDLKNDTLVTRRYPAKSVYDLKFSKDDKILYVNTHSKYTRIGGINSSQDKHLSLSPQALVDIYVKNYRKKISIEKMPEDLDLLKKRYYFSEAERFMRNKDTLNAIQSLLLTIPDNFEISECFNDFYIRNSLDMLSGIYNETALENKKYTIRSPLLRTKHSYDKKYIYTSTISGFVNIYYADNFNLIYSKDYKGSVEGMVMSRDSKYLVTLSNNSKIEILRLNDGVILPYDMVHKNANEIFLSPDGKTLYSYTSIFPFSNGNASLKAWNIDTGEQIDEHGITGYLQHVELSSNGKKILMTDYRDKIIVLDAENLSRKLYSFEQYEKDSNGNLLFFNSAQFSPNGKYLITNTYKNIYIIDADTGVHKFNIDCSDTNIRSIAVSPCSRYIALVNECYMSEGKDHKEAWVNIYDLETGKEACNTLYPGFGVLGLKFLEDSTNIMLYYNKGKSQIWNYWTGYPSSAPLPSNRNKLNIYSLAMERSGSFLWSTGYNFVWYNPVTYKEIVDYYRNK